MVLPVPPSPSSFVNTNAANDSGVDDFIGNSPSLADINLRRRFPGFEPRPTATAAPAAPIGPVQQERDGAALYRDFLNDEFRRRNLPDPGRLFAQGSTYHRVSESTMSPDLIQAGSHLRVLSDEFSRSPMRIWVEEQAARVPLDQLDYNTFSELLYGLFQEGGVTWERVIVLFYFCADLAARAFREELPRQFQNIVEWSLRFFTGERMLQWVTQNGGWVNVMQKSVSQAYKITKIGVFLIGLCALASYFWKSR